MKKLITFFGLMLMITGINVNAVLAGQATNSAAPNFTLVDTNGESHSLSDFKGKYVVLEWVNYDCPFVKKHYSEGNMQGLQKTLTAEGVIWLSINSSAKGKQGAFSASEVNKLIQEKGAMPTAYLLDTDGKVGKLYGAKTTPHMFIINPEGALIYQGAIDSIPSFDVADIAKADNYVLKAISEAKSGQPILNSSTQPYGCSVKY